MRIKRSDLRNRVSSDLLGQIVCGDDEFVDFASLNQDLAAVLFADRAPDLAFEISVLESSDDFIFDAVNRILELAGLTAGALWDWFHVLACSSAFVGLFDFSASRARPTPLSLIATARENSSAPEIVRTTRIPRPSGLARA